MLGKNQTIILNLFRKNIFFSPTIRGLSIKLKREYPRVYDAVKDLEVKKILSLTEVGKSKVCQLSLNHESISYLSFLDEQEAFGKKIKAMSEILGFKEFIDDVVILTGSYASGKQTSKSDLDLVVITKDDAFNKQKLLANMTG